MTTTQVPLHPLIFARNFTAQAIAAGELVDSPVAREVISKADQWRENEAKKLIKNQPVLLNLAHNWYQLGVKTPAEYLYIAERILAEKEDYPGATILAREVAEILRSLGYEPAEPAKLAS